VDVGALASRRLAEVPLRPLRVVCAKDAAEALERRAKSIERLKRRDRDLYVDDRLGGQTRHRSGPDVIDPQRGIGQAFAQCGCLRGK
jgi:hypothetical protein